MSQPPSFRLVRESLAKLRARKPQSRALLALGLVALQLVTALHFALVPHSFSAGLNGFVHVHGEPAAAAGRCELRPTRPVSSAPTLAGASATCLTESCPVGFAGPHSVLLAGQLATELAAFAVTPKLVPPSGFVAVRKRALLCAPKTSPPV